MFSRRAAMLVWRRWAVVKETTWETTMPTVGVKELKTRAAEIVRRVEEGESFVVTRRGKPAVAMVPCPVDLEDLILAEVDAFVRLRAKARVEHRAGKATSWSSLKESPPPRKASAKKPVPSRAVLRAGIR